MVIIYGRELRLNKIEDFDHFAENRETQRKYRYDIRRRSEAFQKELFEKDLLGSKKNDLEHRTYSTIFLIEGPAGCGKTTYTVLHLVMANFGLSEEEAQAKIDEYFEIVEG